MVDQELKNCIRNIGDFPKKGIIFRDITTLLSDKEAFRKSVDMFYDHFKNVKIDKVVSVESRGFIFGSALAYRLGAGFIPVRKPKKLPSRTIYEEYELEYGKDKLEIHADSISRSEKVLIVDDLLATGGTVRAACNLVERLGGEIMGVAFLIELTFLNGRSKIDRYPIFSLVKYDRE